MPVSFLTIKRINITPNVISSQIATVENQVKIVNNSPLIFDVAKGRFFFYL